MPLEVRAPEPCQALVRALYTLISPGTELAMFTRTHVGFDDPAHTWAKYPFYPGYAAVGQIEAVGSEVVGLTPGDLVFYHGRHASYALVEPDTQVVIRIPTPLVLLAPFARFGQIAYTGLHVSHFEANDTVAVLGLGLVGNLAAQLFQIQGATVIGVDLLTFRRECARGAGLHRLIEGEQTDSVTAIQSITQGSGAATVVEATGDPTVISAALRAARRGGEVILLGSPRGEATLNVYEYVHRRGISLKGAHEMLLPRLATNGAKLDQRLVSQRLLHWLGESRLKVEHLITDVIPPQGLERAYHALANEKDRTMAILVDWTEENGRG